MHIQMSRLMEEVYALMCQAHIVVLTGINAFWVNALGDGRQTLATSQDRGDWDFRFDDEEVCILWAKESCGLLEEVYLVFPTTNEFWRKG